MNIPRMEIGNGPSDNKIPVWVKNTAGWWADGFIDDNSFIKGIEFLIVDGIVSIDNK